MARAACTVYGKLVVHLSLILGAERSVAIVERVIALAKTGKSTQRELPYFLFLH